MKNPVLLIALLLLVAAGWLFFSTNDTDHDHDQPHDPEAHAIEAKEPVRADGSFTLAT